MEKVRVALGSRSYDILIGSGILGGLGSRLKEAVHQASPRMAVISNPTVYGLYGATVYKSLREAGFDPVEVLIPDGEEYKSLLWAGHIWAELLKARLDRGSLIIALGGGVIGDIAGFTASTYMRGIRYVQVPTTLLAHADSSVGGKTGVNHPLGKNMIGTFHQPSLVWIDAGTLTTLPRREFLAGLAEVIKYGVIRDRELFEFLEKNRQAIIGLEPDALTHIIKRSCQIKAEVVSRDEREAGLRAILNYGHTIGHAIETATNYKRYLHGEAIAIGMNLEGGIAPSLSTEDRSRIKRLIDTFGLPSELPADIDKESILNIMEIDKKAIAGEWRLALPERIGSVKIQKVGKDAVMGIVKDTFL